MKLHLACGQETRIPMSVLNLKTATLLVSTESFGTPRIPHTTQTSIPLARN